MIGDPPYRFFCDVCHLPIQIANNTLVQLVFRNPSRTKRYLFRQCPLCFNVDYDLLGEAESKDCVQRGIVTLPYALDNSTESLVQTLTFVEYDVDLERYTNPLTFVQRDLMCLHLLNEAGFQATYNQLVREVQHKPD